MHCSALPALSIIVYIARAQVLSGYHTITPADVAFLANNVTANEQAPFQVYHSDFLRILGSNATTTLALNESKPYFHEAGVVTSDNPLTLFTTSNQYNTTSPSPQTNNKTIVISRTVQDSVTGQWTRQTVNNNTAPLLLANGGFPYLDGILFDVQGTLNIPGGLVYLPTDNLSNPTTVINNYLGNEFNSPNDVYVTRNGVIYFTDPDVGYLQNIRPKPSLPNQIYAFVPNTTTIKPVADHFDQPNGLTFSPDERTVYITDTITTDPTTKLPSSRTIYAFDVSYPSDSQSTNSSTPQPGEVAFFTNRRVFAMPGVGIPDGIKCDAEGNVYTGTATGISVYNPAGILLGQIIIGGGTSNFGFASDGRILAMNEDKLWLVQLDRSVQPAVRVGERRG